MNRTRLTLLERERVRQERIQIRLRYANSWIGFLYFLLMGHTAVPWLEIEWVLGFVITHNIWPTLQWLDMRRNPYRPGRRYVLSFIDLIYITTVVALDPSRSMPLLYFMVSVILANGFRYGPAFFRFMMAAGLLGYILAMAFRIHMGLLQTFVELIYHIVCILSIFVFAYSLTLKMEKINRQAERQSLLDPLTGVFNRRAYNHYVQDLDANEVGPSMSLLLVDIDGFKKINDKRGHDQGDTALTMLGEILKDCIRPQDKVYRLGGDEFAIVMEETSPELAQTVAHRIRQQLNANKQAGFTVSMGIASIPDDVPDHKTLMRAADRALYLSKKRGKNRISLAGAA